MSATFPPYGDPVVTGEAVALELRTAGIGSRGIALLLDVLIQGVAAIALSFFVIAVVGQANDAAAEAIVLSAYVALVLGYPVAFETLWRGRTPGKAVMGLRVVRDDGGPLRFRHAFVRGLVGVVLDRPGVSGGLLALVPMLVNHRSKRLGDLAAGTVVLQERVPARVLAPPPMPPELAAWAATLDLARVDDRLALRIRQFLGRVHELAPWARDDLGARLTSDVVAATSAPPPPGVPGWAYLSAVLAERRRREFHRAAAATSPVAVAAVEPPDHPPAAQPRNPQPRIQQPPDQQPRNPGGFAPPA